jgi:hypothetical protein
MPFSISFEPNYKSFIMNRLNTLLLFLCLTCTTGIAQTLQGVTLANLDVNYIRIYQIQGATIFSRYDVCIDFGNGTVARSNSKNNPFKNQIGEPINFNSMMEALNFFSRHSFELATAYHSGSDDNTSGHFFILKRK